MPAARGGRRGGSLGQARRRVHPCVEDTAAWLATHTSRVAVAELLRVAWRTVGRVCARVAAEQATKVDLLEGLGRIGIDEIASQKGQR